MWKDDVISGKEHASDAPHKPIKEVTRESKTTTTIYSIVFNVLYYEFFIARLDRVFPI